MYMGPQGKYDVEILIGRHLKLALAVADERKCSSFEMAANRSVALLNISAIMITTDQKIKRQL